MNILSIDTATSSNSIAIFHQKKIIASKKQEKQNDDLFLDIEQALKENNLQYSDLDSICCTIGPGSFTGIRIGIAAIRGIKQAIDSIAMSGFTTLQIIAYAAAKSLKETNSFYVIMNAFGNEFYLQKFNSDSTPQTEIEIISQDKLISLAENVLTVTNDEMISSLLKDHVCKCQIVHYDASDIIRFYLQYPDSKKTVAPLYIKKPNIHHGAYRKQQSR